MIPKNNQPNGEEKITTMDELVVMINNSFQNNQDYMDERFLDNQEYTDKKFGEVNKTLEKISKNIANLIGNNEFERLETRMEFIENTLNLSKK